MQVNVWKLHGDKIVDRLKELHEAGGTFATIANALSAEFGPVTHLACIGKASRLGLQSKRPPGFDEARRRDRAAATTKRQRSAVLRPKPIAIPIEVRRERAANVEAKHITLNQLTPSTCRYPFGDAAPFSFCGCDVMAGKPYCEPHVMLCFNEYVGADRSGVELRKREYARAQRAAA